MSGDIPEEDAAFEAEMALIEKLADEALEPWKDRLPESQHGWVRERLIEALATHPNASQLVAQLLRGPVVDVSGERGPDVASAEGTRREGGAKR